MKRATVCSNISAQSLEDKLRNYRYCNTKEFNDGWVKLHRRLLRWQWFGHPEMVMSFVYMLLKANYKEGKWGERIVGRGQFVTSYSTLCYDLMLSERTLRTIIKRFLDSGEISYEVTPKGSILTVNNYEKYQGADADDELDDELRHQFIPDSDTILDYIDGKRDTIELPSVDGTEVFTDVCVFDDYNEQPAENQTCVAEPCVEIDATYCAASDTISTCEATSHKEYNNIKEINSPTPRARENQSDGSDNGEFVRRQCDAYMARMFSPGNMRDLNRIVMALSQYNPKIKTIKDFRGFVEGFVCEWKLTGKRHENFQDWSAHLFSLARICGRYVRGRRSDGGDSDRMTYEQWAADMDAKIEAEGILLQESGQEQEQHLEGAEG